MFFLLEILKESITITMFVVVMMMIIEYVNVKSKGSWTEKLKDSVWLQIIISALLGVTPGCLGAFIVVSLYIHRLVRIGALIAALIATFGDEAYILFSLSPKSALQLMAILFFIAVLIGFLFDLIFKKKYLIAHKDPNFILHPEELHCVKQNEKPVSLNLKKISFTRSLLLFGLIVYLIALLSGIFGENHQEEGHHDVLIFGEWLNYTYIFITSLALIIVFLASEHFLEEHIWEHVLKHHFLKIFLWTFGAILAIHLLLDIFDLKNWITNNSFWILIFALIVGLIPESGPHILFLTLFVNGSIPFSVLLANSIVQDGHATLPLFAESKKSFLAVKGIKFIIGFLVGLSGYFLGW